MICAVVLIVACVLVLEGTQWAATRLIEGLLALGGLALAAWATRGWVRNATVVVCSLVFGLTALEGALLTIGAFHKKPPKVVLKDDSLGGGRPVLGWGPTKPGVFRWSKVTPEGKVIYDTHVTVDPALNRKTIPSEGPRPIVFFGDSWIFGDGVEDDGTLPQAFADLEHRRIPVLNLSFNGWSPAVNLAALETNVYKPLLRDPRHFILFTATFHLERTACKGEYATSSAPRYELANGTVRYVGPCSDAHGGLFAPVMRFLRKFEFYQRVAPKIEAPGKQDVDTYIKIIETFVTTAKHLYNVKTTVLFAPFRDEYIKDSGYTEADIIARLRNAGIDVLVDKLPDIADNQLYWIDGDGHPTALANRARAREIAAHLKLVDPKALEVDAVPAAATR